MRIKSLIKEIEALPPRAERLVKSFPWRVAIYRRRSRVAAALPIAFAIIGAFVTGAMVTMLAPRAQRQRVLTRTRGLFRELKPMAAETREAAREIRERVKERVDHLRSSNGNREQVPPVSR